MQKRLIIYRLVIGVSVILSSVVARRDIAKGDEITFNYNDTEAKLASPFNCNCCDKLIKGRSHVVASRTKL